MNNAGEEGISEGFRLAKSERAVPGGAGAEGHATPPSSYLERINPTPEQFAIHQQMSFHVLAFCEQGGHLTVVAT